jgi:hypothetical protein
MSVLAGSASVVVCGALAGFLYIFDPTGKQVIEKHLWQCFLGATVLFVGVFGLSLELELTTQFWRGKWK